MNLPAWIKDIVDYHGSKRLDGTVGRQEAVTAVRDEIAAKAGEALRLAIYADYAGRALDAWQREHQNPAAPAPVSSLQGELFPDLKPRLFVQPGVSKPVMTMTAHDWDNACAMIRNRTEGAIESAEADWKNFEAAYKRVRPLLAGEFVTADVVRELRGEVPLEGLAP
jgi:hypothetical protein